MSRVLQELLKPGLRSGNSARENQTFKVLPDLQLLKILMSKFSRVLCTIN